jgi:hypothetical protein
MNMLYTEVFPYRIRLKMAIIVMMFLAIMLFKFWPQSYVIKELDLGYFEDRPIIMLDPTVVTIQKKSLVKPSPPSKTISPVQEPKVVTITTTTPAPASSSGSVGNAEQSARSGQPNAVVEPRISEKPTRLPSVVRIVEPVVPEAVKANRIRAELTVRVLVGVDGSVEKAEILEIRSFNPKSGKYEKVNDIAFGIKEATLQAAMGWKFRPAFEGNEKVKFWSRHLFTFGT